MQPGLLVFMLMILSFRKGVLYIVINNVVTFLLKTRSSNRMFLCVMKESTMVMVYEF